MNAAIQILDFMKVIEKLCLVERDNLLSKGGNESDSDHVFKLCFLIMMAAPYLKGKYDYAKMLEIALAHDIVEARTGDISLSAQVNNPELKARKKANEAAAIEYYKSILPAPLNEKIYGLFMEYEERKTKEAQVVYVLDKLEAHMQANQYNDGDVNYWGDCPNGHMYYKMALREIPTSESKYLKSLDEDILKEIEELVIKISQENMEKCKICVNS